MSAPLAPAGRAPTRRDVWVGMLLYPAHTLPTAAAPVIVACGLAVRDGRFAPVPAVLAFLAGWLIQVGGVVTDNYFNLTRHADDREHAAFVHALRVDVVTLRELRTTIAACYAVAALAGLYLVYVGGLPVLLIGLVSALASLGYSAGPFPLGDNGLGDPLFFAFFGVVSVGAAYYVQAAAATAAPLAPALLPGLLTWRLLIVSLPMGALITNILIIDNIRDLEYDHDKGERTLAVLIGKRASRVELIGLLVLAYAVPVWLRARGGMSRAVLLPLLTIPLAVTLAREVSIRDTHDALVPMTPRAGRLTLIYAILFAVGIAS